MGDVQYLILDARYEKMRKAGQVRDTAVLVASGITQRGKADFRRISVSERA